MMLLTLLFYHQVTPLSVHPLKWLVSLQPMNNARFNNLSFTLSRNFCQYLQPLSQLLPLRPLLQTARFFLVHHLTVANDCSIYAKSGLGLGVVYQAFGSFLLALSRVPSPHGSTFILHVSLRRKNLRVQTLHPLCLCQFSFRFAFHCYCSSSVSIRFYI